MRTGPYAYMDYLGWMTDLSFHYQSVLDDRLLFKSKNENLSCVFGLSVTTDAPAGGDW